MACNTGFTKIQKFHDSKIQFTKWEETVVFGYKFFNLEMGNI
jgi:hypothetical protein